MKITIDLNNPQDIAEGLALLGSTSTNFAPDLAAAPPAAPAAAAAPAPAAAPPATPPATTPATPPATTPAAVTEAQFAEAVQAFAKANSPKAAKAVFAQFGFTKTSDIPPEQYANIMPHFVVA